MRRGISRLLLSLLLVLLLATGVVAWLLGSHGGAQWVVAQLPGWLPGELRIGRLEGRLLDDFEIHDLSYQQADGLRVEIAHLQGSWALTALRQQTLHLRRVEADHIVLHLPPPSGANTPVPETLPELHLPVWVRLDALHLRQLEIHPASGAPWLITELTTQVALNQQLDLQQLHLRAPWLTLDLQGQIGLSAPHNLALSASWDAPLSAAGHTQGTARLQGSLADYQLSLHNQLDSTRWPSHSVTLQAQGDWRGLHSASSQLQLLGGQVTANGHLRWLPALDAQLAVQTQQLELAPYWPTRPLGLRLNSQWQLRFAKQVLYVDSGTLELPEQARLHLQASAALHSDIPQFQAKLHWEKLRWPLAEALPQFESAQGWLTLNGQPDAYQLALEASAQGQQLPAGRWQAQAQGSPTGLRGLAIQASLLAGQAQLTGQLDWAPALAWQLRVQGEQLNPGQHWPAWPGKLALDVRSQGQLLPQGPLLDLQIDKADGQLRGYPLRLTGSLHAKNGDYALKNLALHSGQARLAVTGHYGQQLSADWQLDAPDLAALWPQLKGRLSSQGKIAGGLDAPQIQAKLTGSGLQFAQLRLDKLTAALDLDAGLRQALKFTLNAERLQQEKKVLLDSLNLSSAGRLDAHTLQATLKGPLGNGSMALRGAMDKSLQHWRGDLQKLSLSHRLFGSWGLRAPTAMQWTPTQFSVAELCLSPQQQASESSGLCLKANQNAAGIAALTLNLQRLPLRLAAALLPDDTKLTGTLTGEVQMLRQPQGALTGNARLDLSPGQLSTVLANDLRHFPLKGGQLLARIERSGLHATLDLGLLAHSRMQMSLDLPGLTPLSLSAQQPLQGRIQAQFDDMGIIAGVVPQLENISGTLSLDMQLAGNLAAPQLRGSLQAQKISTELPLLGLRLHELGLQIRADGSDTLHVEAGLHSGEGRLQVQGQVVLKTLQDWQAELRVQGERLQIIDTADLHGLASPDLTIALRNGLVKIRGTVQIPSATLTPNIVLNKGDDKQAVALSSDVRLVNTDAPPAAPKSAWQIDSDVLVTLGNEINLNIVGFKSQLAGAVQLRLVPGKEIPLGNGALFIKKGIYRAYGQDLEINQGLVIFSDGPIDNPGLDIQAVRKIYRDSNLPKVERAGVHITGTVKNPRINLFSDPMVEESQILSYIITGSALSGDVANRSLSLGTYVMPNLYVSFGFSLFDESKVFNMRYELSEKWGMESTLGDKDSGVDLSYTLGR